MPDFLEKSLPAVRLAARTAVITDSEDIATTLGVLFDESAEAIALHGLAVGIGVGEYDMSEFGMTIVAGYVCDVDIPGLDTVELPAVDLAACGVHRGGMERIGETWQSLFEWLGAHGYQASGPCREVYNDTTSPDPTAWVTELQQPVIAKR